MGILRSGSILLIAGSVWLFGPASVGSVPEAQAARAYLLTCRGGGGMNANWRWNIRRRGVSNALRIFFRKARNGAGRRPPGPGECAWQDRPIRRNEPSQLYYTSRRYFVMGFRLRYRQRAEVNNWDGRRMKHLVNAVLNGGQFFVYAYKRRLGNREVLYVDRLGP